ncbi:unnamed protein product [Durusdinium trenchii]|uniref:General transcription factor TFIIB n=1 Tax=Durusdinium trenchii TaxID=1381693 RepID=A0ABP0SWG2_9DINO
MADIAIDPRTSCRYCRDSQVIYDSSQGTAVCTGCGTVLEDHCFDEGREWRNFAPEGVDSQPNGRERADLTNSIDHKTGQGCGTVIVGVGTKAQRMQEKLFRVQSASKPELSAGQKEDRNIQHQTEKAREVAMRLNLGEEIVNRCTVLLQDLAAKGLLKERYQTAWYCALVEIACEEEPYGKKTVHDFAHAHRQYITNKVEPPQLKRKEGIITATFNQASIAKELKGEVVIGNVKVALVPGDQASLLVRSWGQIGEEELGEFFRQRLEDMQQALDRARATYLETEDLYKNYVRSLGLAAEVVKPAKHIATEALKHRLVRTGKDLAERSVVTGAMASAIFVVAWLLDVEKKPRLEDVAKAAKVSEGYAKMTYSSIRREISRVLPKDYLSRYIDRVRTLPQPDSISRKRPAEFPAGR